MLVSRRHRDRILVKGAPLLNTIKSSLSVSTLFSSVFTTSEKSLNVSSSMAIFSAFIVPFAGLALLAFAEQSFHHSLSDQQKADFLWFPSHLWPVPL